MEYIATNSITCNSDMCASYTAAIVPPIVGLTKHFMIEFKTLSMSGSIPDTAKKA